MSSGKVEWSSDGTVNFQSGCSEARHPDGRMREECRRCYARIMSGRLRRMGTPRYQDATTGDGPNRARWTGRLTWDREAMRAGFRSIGPGKRKFVGSMTDLWHDDCDPEMHAALAEEVAGMRGIGMFLTKRPKNLLAWQRRYFPAGLPPRMWVGVTAGTQPALDAMAPDLEAVDALGVRYVSVEPMTGPVVPSVMSLARFDWWIVGCESLSGRPGAVMDLAWVRSLRDAVVGVGGSFFFKQAVVNGVVTGTPELDGQTWTQVPGGTP